MGNKHSVIRMVLIFAATLLVSGALTASTTKLVYSFAGGSDGEYLDTELVMDNAGNLYGTSVQGGAFGSGTVFQVTTAEVHTVLYSFTGGPDGGEPYKGVTLDAQGNLYGTAVTGGGGACEGGCGVVFKLAKSGGSWTQSVIHTFTGSDGSGPGSPVAFDAHGNIYGTTPTGGANGLGVVYQLKPNGTGGWTYHIIHTFTGGEDGSGGSAGRFLVDTDGNLFNVCTVGGANGFGVVYEMSPTQSGQWRFTTLYAFKDSPDGALPYGGLVFDKAGNLYGTTYYAGAHDLGTVYKLTRNGTTWSESVLYSFKGGTDGANPISSLVADSSGNLYGTTSEAGASTCGCGVIFKMTRGATGKWAESVVYRFPGSPDPGFAYNGMISGSGGTFYGATVHGGGTNDGTIYQFTP
jgi:uncharacterized repeat protein (TIGR03803 family)